jgi:pyruvate/2-oxoglutarate/acetoin dehydrogenase E1 component
VPDTPIPFAPAMERAVIPGEDDIRRAIEEVLQ